MRKKNHFLRRIFAGILTSLMVLTAAPQMPLVNQTVTVEAAAVKLSAKKLTLKKGQTKKLKLKNAAGKVRWKSNKKSVASVSANGTVKAKGSGKATITATYKNKKYKCTVTVTGKKTAGKTGSEKEAVVYWTPGGAVYHVSRNCPTLSRSRSVLSGSISKSGKSRACKVCS